MKTEDLYIFYSDEDVATLLKEKIGIKADEERGDPECEGLYECATASFETQLKEAKWLELGVGRYAVLYYIDMYDVGDEDEGPMISMNFSHARVIVRHNTKKTIRETEDGKKVFEALTVLDKSDIL